MTWSRQQRHKAAVSRLTEPYRQASFRRVLAAAHESGGHVIVRTRMLGGAVGEVVELAPGHHVQIRNGGSTINVPWKRIVGVERVD